MSNKTEKATGDLFGRLFSAYDDKLYLNSIALFSRRFRANGFPLEWFQGKVCLDAGCGSGRYSIALSLLGAKNVFGIDVGRESIRDARKRAKRIGTPNVKFKTVSIEKLPFKDKFFDAVIFSGVLHHTLHQDRAMSEIARVLRPKGMLYTLVYATGGIRWPLVQSLRPFSQKIGFKVMDLAVNESKLPVNKRRTYLDDLFVPLIDFYTWERLNDMLRFHGFEKIQRWEKGRFDHEENLDTYKNELKNFKLLFESGSRSKLPELKRYRKLFQIGERLCDGYMDYVLKIREKVKIKRISNREAMKIVVGQGHHRVIAWKGK